MWSWEDTNKEQKSASQTIKTSININITQKNFYSIRDNIIHANTFPDTNNFDDEIIKLSYI